MKSKKSKPKGRIDYSDAGVDTEKEELGLQSLVEQIQQTWPPSGKLGAVKLPIGYFANVLDLGTIGLALSADGVGTKVLIAQMMERYDTVGIDCVAMNVNDLICVGATPISMVDYIAVQKPEPRLLGEIGKGLSEGAKMAGISISGGEIAQLKEIVTGVKEGYGFDLAGMAVGTVPLDKMIIGKDINESDVIIGLESNGIHSNGLTLARRVFFEEQNFSIDDSLPGLENTLGEELLKPTHIYVKEILDIMQQDIPLKALIHITSDGFLNLTRVESEVGYKINNLPDTPPIFKLIQKYGKISDEEMYRVYNMGIGFCIIVAPEFSERVVKILQSHNRKAHLIGHPIFDKEQRVYIEQAGLVGKDDRFEKIN